MNSAHRYRLRIYYEDTDAGGVVYHANFLKYAERARTEWLRTAGLDHKVLRDRFGLLIVVHKITAQFQRPAMLDDELTVHSQLEHARGARMVLKQVVARGEMPIAELSITLATIDLAGRPLRLPRELARALESVSP